MVSTKTLQDKLQYTLSLSGFAPSNRMRDIIVESKGGRMRFLSESGELIISSAPIDSPLDDAVFSVSRNTATSMLNLLLKEPNPHVKVSYSDNKFGVEGTSGKIYAATIEASEVEIPKDQPLISMDGKPLKEFLRASKLCVQSIPKEAFISSGVVFVSKKDSLIKVECTNGYIASFFAIRVDDDSEAFVRAGYEALAIAVRSNPVKVLLHKRFLTAVSEDGFIVAATQEWETNRPHFESIIDLTKTSVAELDVNAASLGTFCSCAKHNESCVSISPDGQVEVKCITPESHLSMHVGTANEGEQMDVFILTRHLSTIQKLFSAATNIPVRISRNGAAYILSVRNPGELWLFNSLAKQALS